MKYLLIFLILPLLSFTCNEASIENQKIKKVWCDKPVYFPYKLVKNYEGYYAIKRITTAEDFPYVFLCKGLSGNYYQGGMVKDAYVSKDSCDLKEAFVKWNLSRDPNQFK